MLITIKESIIIDSGRIHEILSCGLSLSAMNQGTWSELFKTRAYKRRKAAMQRILAHARRMTRRLLEREGIYWDDWKVELVGSTRTFDIVYKTNQVYEIIKIRG